MTHDEFTLKQKDLGIEGTGINARVKHDIVYKSKITKQITATIPKGVTVKIYFSPKVYPSKYFLVYDNFIGSGQVSFANKKLSGINKPPTLSTLERRNSSGISKSVTGKIVEPDGFGPDGSPSWELVMGII